MSELAILALLLIVSTHFGYSVYCRGILATQCRLNRVVADVATTTTTTSDEEAEERKRGREIGDPLVSKAVECMVGCPSSSKKNYIKNASV